MQFPLIFHPVWQEKLSNDEKANYQKYAEELSDSDTPLLPIRINEKKNGGLVATVFIQNGKETNWLLTSAIVTVYDEMGQICAVEQFPVKLDIPPKSMMLWSFVFAPTSRLNKNTPSDKWTVYLES